jgi:hypothetical protein
MRLTRLRVEEMEWRREKLLLRRTISGDGWLGSGERQVHAIERRIVSHRKCSANARQNNPCRKALTSRSNFLPLNFSNRCLLNMTLLASGPTYAPLIKCAKPLINTKPVVLVNTDLGENFPLVYRVRRVAMGARSRAW